MGLFRILLRAMSARPPPRYRVRHPQDRPIPREMRFPVPRPGELHPPRPVISGYCYVIDGDTIVIDGRHIRIAGIDAPELDHPWGQKSKWALFALCKDQRITAQLKPELTHGRLVAECFLPDGRDLAAELVKAGLALDWPKFSGGKYRHLEPADARQKLWRASLRQGGMMPPRGTGDFVPVSARYAGPSSAPFHAARRPAAVEAARPPKASYRFGWLSAAGVLLVLVGCNFVGSDADRNLPANSSRQAAALASFEVTANVLNVRREPTATSGVIAQIGRGTAVMPKRVSGPWYGVEMSDGSTGWVHGDFLRPAGE